MVKSKTADKGVKYNLVYRSSTDVAHAGEEVPSAMVMVPATNANALRRGGGNDSVAPTAGAATSKMNKKSREAETNHVDALGLPNDGYDYTQHMRSMGQGKFIGADGKEQKLPEALTQGMEIPTELLPSKEELNRGLETITLDDRTMDEDLRKALFEECDEDGEFEELRDDFIMTAMQEPIETTFDWDAHMAMLISRSESMSGVGTSKVKPRGWENEIGTAGAKMAAKHAIAGVGEGDEEEYDSDDSGFIPDDILDDDFGQGKAQDQGHSQDSAAADATDAGMFLTAGRLAQMSLQAGQSKHGKPSSGDYDDDNITNFSDDRQSKYSKASRTSVGSMYSANGTKLRFKPRSSRRTLAEEKLRQERLFEATLEEYGEDDIGDLEHLYYAEAETESETEDECEEREELTEEERFKNDKEKEKRIAEREKRNQAKNICGKIDAEDLENHPALDEALNDFLEAKIADEWMAGVVPRERTKSELQTEKNENEKLINNAPQTADEFKAAVAEHCRLQQQQEDEIREEMANSGKMITMKDIAALQTTKFDLDRHDELIECQAYLQETREEAEWDCETVLSTYSTLDNHPKLLKEPKNSRFKPHKSRFIIRREREEAESDQISVVDGGREALTKAAYQASRDIGGLERPDKPQPARITLSGKLSLPEGYGGIEKRGRAGRDSDGISVVSGRSGASNMSTNSTASRFTVKSSATGAYSLGSATEGGTSIKLRMPMSASHAATSKTHRQSELRHGISFVDSNPNQPNNKKNVTQRIVEEEEEDMLEEEEEGEGDGDEYSEGFTKNTSNTQWTLASRKAETKDEKKVRKAQAKEQQSLRRKNKKILREVYSDATGTVNTVNGSRSTLENVSVFRY